MARVTWPQEDVTQLETDVSVVGGGPVLVGSTLEYIVNVTNVAPQATFSAPASVFAGFALGSLWFSMAILVAALTVPVLLTAFVVPFALPSPRSSVSVEASDT